MSGVYREAHTHCTDGPNSFALPVSAPQPLVGLAVNIRLGAKAFVANAARFTLGSCHGRGRRDVAYLG